MLKVDNVRDMLKQCEEYHGHLCTGQVMGVRLAKKGLELVEAKDIKELIVFVENDRCITDAITIASGVRLGRRSLKFLDYGKMAATFVNQRTGEAWRVASRGDAELPPEQAMTRALEADDETLLTWQKVTVTFGPGDLPGPPVRIAKCFRCGETVLDHRDVIVPEEGSICRACAHGPYYRPCP
ncbi:MAG: FmdE family protein [Syntrophotaleaceae bacterium]